MPRIPIYEQQTRSSSAGLGLGPTAQSSGRGATLAALGQHAQAAADVFHADGVARANDAVTRLDEAAEQLLRDEANNLEPGAEGFTPAAVKKFDELARSVQSEATTKASIFNRRNVGEFVQAKTAEIRARFEGRAKTVEATERVRFRDDLFAQAAERTRTTLELDPERWGRLAAEQMAAIVDSGLPPIEQAKVRARLESAVTEGAAMGYAKRDPQATLAELGNADTTNPIYRNLSGQARDRVQRMAQGQLIESNVAAIVDTYTKAGTDAGIQAFAQLDKSGLPPATQDEVRRGVSSRLSQYRDLRRQENVDAIANIERSIANNSAGTRTMEHVEDLYQLGALTPAEYGNYAGQIESAAVRRLKDQAAAHELAAVIGAGLPLDPRNPEHRKALSSAFAENVREQPAGSPVWQATASAYAARTRMLPDQALAWTRQTTRSPDPRIAAAGAQFYGAIAAGAPDAVGEVDTDTKAFASTVNAMIEAGTDPARAVETARSTVFDLKPEVRERRKTEFEQHAKQSDAALANLVDRDFDPGVFASAPALSANLAADFVSQSERYFQKTGDVTLARDLAWSDLKRVYGPSRVNGEPIMIAFPPERFGIPPEEVRTDIGNFLKGNPQADGSGAADVFVVPDAVTLRQVNDTLDGRPVQPSYKLITKSGDLVLDRNGVPKRYTIPSGEELAQRFKGAQAKAEGEARAMVDQARGEREQRRRDAYAYRGYSGPGVMR